MAAQAAMSQAQILAAARAQNVAIRNYITQNCPEDVQCLVSTTVASGNDVRGTVYSVPPKNVGLITMFVARIDVDITAPAGINLIRSPFGACNLLSKIEFTDLSNLTRISTSGTHLALLASARHRRPDGSAKVSDSPLGFGSNFNPGIVCPPTIAAGTTATVSMVYEIPLAYSKNDLRGAVYAGVVNATMNLALTFNPQLTAFGTDTVQSVYTQSAAGSVLCNNGRVQIYQKFYDQLPLSTGGPALPVDDLTTSYQLKSTSLSGLAVGQDFGVPFTNFSDFLSTILIYDNGGQLNPGTDINSISLLTANASQLWKVPTWLLSYETRNLIETDMPLGCYYFDQRRRPINTIQYGNIQLVINPSLVNPGAQVFAMYEQMTKQGVINASGSLPSG